MTYDDHPPEQWEAFLAAWKRGERLKISESIYWYFLEVLPPIFYARKNVELVTGDRIVANFGFAEGAERITAFWMTETRSKPDYFLQYTREVNRG